MGLESECSGGQSLVFKPGFFPLFSLLASVENSYRRKRRSAPPRFGGDTREVNVIRNGTAVGAITLSANAFYAFQKPTTFFAFLNFSVAFFLSFSKTAPSPHRLTLPVGGR
jgi:hypothetical protein